MKYLKWFLASILIMPIAVFLMLVASNAVDETLSSKAEALIRQVYPTTERGTKAFYYFLGLRAGDSKDPEARGRELWQAGLNVPVDKEVEFFGQNIHDRHWPSFNLHPAPKDVPLSKDWKARPELRAELAKNQFAVDEYIHLLEYGEMSPLESRYLIGRATGSPMMMLAGHRWLRVYFGKLAAENKWKELQRLVQLENRFQSSFLVHHTLLTVMIAEIAIHDNLMMLSLEKQPVSGETVASFNHSKSEVMIANALDSELRHYASSMKLISAGDFAKAYFNEPLFLNYIPLRLFFLPNESINQYAVLDEARSRKYRDVEKYQTYAWANPKWPWQWLHNPLGRRSWWIFTTSMEPRFRVLEKREAEDAELLAHLPVIK
jgi:hypothetical protein